MAHGHAHGHDGHPPGSREGRPADGRWLLAALTLILAFMAGEVVVGILARSLALITDAGHMLTDAAAIALAIVAARLAQRPARGSYTFGLRRVEILAAQANGLTLWLLAVWFTVEGVRRLADPPDIEGGWVVATAGAGIVVNLLATWLIARADRGSLNVEGAFQHILNDLFAFIATAVAGLVILLTGWTRADAVAALVVAALMVKGGWGLLRESWRIFLEAAPRGVDVAAIDEDLHQVDGVVEIHDLHVWEVTSGFPALSAHILVDTHHDCHERRQRITTLLEERHGITHTTLQVEHPATPPLFTPDDVRAGPHPETRP
jgi:cobalt-zinc-cadmium efflux system protein